MVRQRPVAEPEAGALKAWAAERIERWKLPDRIHLADAIEKLTAKTFDSLSDDRGPKDPYSR